MKDFVFYLTAIVTLITYYGSKNFKKGINKIKRILKTVPIYIKKGASFLSPFFEHRYFKNGFIGTNAILLLLNMLLCPYIFIQMMATYNNQTIAIIAVLFYGVASINLCYRSIKLMGVSFGITSTTA